MQPVLSIHETGDDEAGHIVSGGVDHGRRGIHQVADDHQNGEGDLHLSGEENGTDDILSDIAAAGDAAHAYGAQHRHQDNGNQHPQIQSLAEDAQHKGDFQHAGEAGAVHVHRRAQGQDHVADVLGDAGVGGLLHIGGDGRHGGAGAQGDDSGLGDMLEEVAACFPDCPDGEEEDDRPRVAIVGKPNVGKSSLINKLLGENRLIVSDIAGTTRDAIDTEIAYKDKEYVFIDTAGLRRKNKVKENLERYMIVRTVSAVERADVVVLVIDAVEGVTEQDAKIAGIAHDRGKAVIIAVNKWDAVEKDDKTIYRVTEKVRNTLSYMPYAEILFVSAQTGQRLNKLFETIDIVSENHAMRVATGVLNEIMAEAVAMHQPPTDKGKRLRLYYITQVSVKPPTFVIFVNDKKLMHFSYTRYIENQIRETFGFKGTPLKFIIRERSEKGGTMER